MTLLSQLYFDCFCVVLFLLLVFYEVECACAFPVNMYISWYIWLTPWCKVGLYHGGGIFTESLGRFFINYFVQVEHCQYVVWSRKDSIVIFARCN